MPNKGMMPSFCRRDGGVGPSKKENQVSGYDAAADKFKPDKSGVEFGGNDLGEYPNRTNDLSKGRGA